MDYHYYRSPSNMGRGLLHSPIFTLTDPSPEFEKVMIIFAAYTAVFTPSLTRVSVDPTDGSPVTEYCDSIVTAPRLLIDWKPKQIRGRHDKKLPMFGVGMPGRPFSITLNCPLNSMSDYDIITWYHLTEGRSRFRSDDDYYRFLKEEAPRRYVDFYNCYVEEIY